MRRIVRVGCIAVLGLGVWLLLRNRGGAPASVPPVEDASQRASDRPLLRGHPARDNLVRPVAGTSTPARSEGARLCIRSEDGQPIEGIVVRFGDYNAPDADLASAESDADGQVPLPEVLRGSYCRYAIDDPSFAPASGPFFARGNVNLTLHSGSRVLLELSDQDATLVGQKLHFTVSGMARTTELTGQQTFVGFVFGELRIERVGDTRPAPGTNEFLLPSAGEAVIRFVPEPHRGVAFTLHRPFRPEDTALFVSPFSDKYPAAIATEVDERDPMRMRATLGLGRYVVLGRNGGSVCVAEVDVASDGPPVPIDLPWQRGCSLTLELPAEVEATGAAVYILAHGPRQIEDATSSVEYYRVATPTGWLDMAEKTRPLPAGRRWPQDPTLDDHLVSGIVVPTDTLVRCSVSTREHGVLVRDVLIEADAVRVTAQLPRPHITTVSVQGLDNTVRPTTLVLSIWRAGASGPAPGSSPEQVRLDAEGLARVVGLQVGQRYLFQIQGGDVVGAVTRRVSEHEAVEIQVAPREYVKRTIVVLGPAGTPLENVLVTIFSPEGEISDRRVVLTTADGIASADMPKGMTVSATVSDPRYVSPYVDIPSEEQVEVRASAAGSVTLVNHGPGRLLTVEYTVKGRFVPVPPRRMLPNAVWHLGRVPAGSLSLRVRELDASGAPIGIIAEQVVDVSPFEAATVELN